MSLVNCKHECTLFKDKSCLLSHDLDSKYPIGSMLFNLIYDVHGLGTEVDDKSVRLVRSTFSELHSPVGTLG
jgi:hypothetical protein